MTREEALRVIRENVKNENLIKHMLATEAIMRALARKFGENEDLWGTAGLLHDIDVELTRGDAQTHSQLGAAMLQKMGLPDTVCHAVLVHNEAHGEPYHNLMDKSIYCCDPLTGLITAVALVYPDKKLKSVEVKSIEKRFRQPKFAAGARRETIAACHELLGLELVDFIKIGLEAMQGVSDDLGL